MIIYPHTKTSETPTGYTVHVFQWKTSELQGVLEKFLQSFNKMVNGKAGVEDFIKELTSDMEWIVNHCFSLQDVSSMKDDIKKQFDWDETHSECEVEGETNGRLSKADKLDFPKGYRQRPAPSTRRKKDDVIIVSPDVPDATVVRLQSLSAVGTVASVARISVDVDGKVAASPEKL
ncbi:filament-like plant protein 7 isoform X1 [Tanacetum coccineum]|uniref:Filament-like plant protein 7 isoform X1 n=1 Tax=Tanacetum coccineum TaxID=301880 RepID=A0ABQ4YS23_9ASTR